MSRFTPGREKCGLPLPRGYGPASVEPPSQAMTCGLSETPRAKDDSIKPEPIWPDADNTLISVMSGSPLPALISFSAQLLQGLVHEARLDRGVQIRLSLDSARLAIDRQQLLEILALEPTIVGPGADPGGKPLPDRAQRVVADIGGAGHSGVFAVAASEIGIISVGPAE